MKKQGAILEFASERNAEVMKAYRAVARRVNNVNMRAVTSELVKQPAPRFWVSEERATDVVSLMLRGADVLKGMRASKRRMFEEICKRVVAERSLRPGTPLKWIVADVIYSPAPEFYMEPLTAQDIIYNRIRQCRRKRL